MRLPEKFGKVDVDAVWLSAQKSREFHDDHRNASERGLLEVSYREGGGEAEEKRDIS